MSCELTRLVPSFCCEQEFGRVGVDEVGSDDTVNIDERSRPVGVTLLVGFDEK